MSSVIRGIGQLATCPITGGQDHVGIIEGAALVQQQGRVVWVGEDSDLPTEFQSLDALDAQGALVVPGLIDCHTHLCFGGWRGDEFEMRIQGQSYQAIAEAGGGIRSTVAATRNTNQDDLTAKASAALAQIIQLGVTTLECKSGYGLSVEHELKQLRVYQSLQQSQPIELVPTFLGAHIVPPEYSEQRDTYVRLICDTMLPQIAEEKLAEFCDVYIDTGAFSLDEGKQILSRAKALGLGLKAHAEQLSYTGAAAMAANLGAASLEHLEYLDHNDLQTIQQAGSVAVSLPFASLYLRERYLDCRSLIEQGIPVAVATDFNPGSAPSYQLPMAMTLACLNQQMTPAEVLKGCTIYAAKALQREQRIGSLLPGFQADLAMINAPTVNHWMYHLQSNACVGVMKNGNWVHQA